MAIPPITGKSCELNWLDRTDWKSTDFTGEKSKPDFSFWKHSLIGSDSTSLQLTYFGLAC